MYVYMCAYIVIIFAIQFRTMCKGKHMKLKICFVTRKPSEDIKWANYFTRKYLK